MVIIKKKRESNSPHSLSNVLTTLLLVMVLVYVFNSTLEIAGIFSRRSWITRLFSVLPVVELKHGKRKQSFKWFFELITSTPWNFNSSCKRTLYAFHIFTYLHIFVYGCSVNSLDWDELDHLTPPSNSHLEYAISMNQRNVISKIVINQILTTICLFILF